MPVAILALTAVLVIPQPTLPRLAIAFIGGAAVITTLWTWQTWRRERPQARLAEIGKVLRDCFHYGVSGLVWNVYLRIGVLTLTFLNSPVEVAFFAAAYKLIDLAFKIAVLTNRVVAPRLYADSAHRPGAFANSSEMLLRMTVGAGSLGSLLLFVAGAWIIEMVYGSAFAASGALIRILGVSLTLKTIALMAQTIIAAADDHSYRMKVVSAATAVAIALAVPLALQWGAIGVACAVVAGDVVLLGMLIWRVRSTQTVRRVTPIFAVPLLGALVCAAALMRIEASVVLEALGVILAYGGWLVLSGYLSPIVALLRAQPRTAGKVP